MSNTNIEQTTLVVSYERLSALTKEDLTNVGTLQVVLDESKPETILTSLKCDGDGWARYERYDSLKELSTVCMKELLILYIKRAVIATDTTFFKTDDPRVHAFLSKLSYAGIKFLSDNIIEFATEFKTGNVKMHIPRNPNPASSRKFSNRK